MLFLAIFFGYFLSFVLYFVNFEQRKDSLSEWANKVTEMCALLHFIFLLATVSAHHFVIKNLLDAVYVGSFLIVAVSLFLQNRYKAKFLMLFSLPITLLLCLFAILLSQKNTAAPTALSETLPWLWLHTGLILTGFTSLIIAFSSALMYILQSAQLKSRQPGRIFSKLPSLNTLDRLHFTSLSWGVILFSLGVLSGFFWATNMKELHEILRDPKVILSFVTCAMYWTILSFRLSALRRGQKIAAGTVIIFVLLFITFISSQFAPTGFHKGF